MFNFTFLDGREGTLFTAISTHGGIIIDSANHSTGR